MMSLVTLLATTLLYLMCYASPLIKRATLTEVTNFGGNPASIRMYIYVPDTLAASPGIVVSLHGASGTLNNNTNLRHTQDSPIYMALLPSTLSLPKGLGMQLRASLLYTKAEALASQLRIWPNMSSIPTALMQARYMYRVCHLVVLWL